MKTILQRAIEREEGRVKAYKTNKENKIKIRMSEELIKAAKKEIGINPDIKIEHDGWDDREIHEYEICPKCKKEVYPTNKYCSRCGQKLDWSDEDE